MFFDTVQVVKNLVEHGLVTCGADSMIIIWKVSHLGSVCIDLQWNEPLYSGHP